MKKQGKTTQNANLPEESEIPIEKLLEYRKKNLTYEEIAALTGKCRQTVSNLIHKADLDGLDTFEANRDKVFASKQREIVNSLTDAKIKDMSGLQLITGAAILQDKIQVIRGQATVIIDHRVMVLDLNRAIDQLRAEQAQEAGDIQDAEVINSPVKCPLSENSE